MKNIRNKKRIKMKAFRVDLIKPPLFNEAVSNSSHKKSIKILPLLKNINSQPNSNIQLHSWTGALTESWSTQILLTRNCISISVSVNSIILKKSLLSTRVHSFCLRSILRLQLQTWRCQRHVFVIFDLWAIFHTGFALMFII